MVKLVIRSTISAIWLLFVLRAELSGGSDAVQVVFSRDIAPILTAHCYSCHGPDGESRKSDLRLDQLGDNISAADTQTTVINPGKAELSALFQRIRTDDPELRMPPSQGAALSPDQIELIRSWIQQGANSPHHWALVPPLRPELPPVEKVSWPRSPVDHFILNRLEAAGLDPSPVADRRTLLRRLSLDLTGLPPTIAEIKNFLGDTSPGSWNRLLDRVMSSPRYGERMAQGWLDAARYADTTGHAADKPRTMWLFRDWVIDAFNSNMPFDQFTIEQIAGDMLPHATASQRIATGFHRNSMQALGNNPRKEEFRIKGIVDRLDTTGRVWLGLSLGCAECHDHKYDPISQKEYYRLFAVFNNVPHYGERFDVHGPRIEVLPALRQFQVTQLKRRLERRATDLCEESDADRLTRSRRRPCGERTERSGSRRLRLGVERDVPATVPCDVSEELERLRQEIKELESQTVTAQVMDELPKPRQTFVHIRGNFENPGELVQAALPSILDDGSLETAPVTRLSLARSLVNDRNPLTARVIVNRIWQHHFGNGLVVTADDFGVRGEYPSHPGLLDWLATEFVASGWDRKHIHRLIVSSATYRQSSHLDSRLRSLDPQNRLLARGPRMRLPAEQIRDVMLFASGKLVERMGGPSVFPLQDASIGQFRDDTAGTWTNSSGAGQYRRAIYTFWQRMSPYPSLVIFDAPSRERCAVARPRTNTPLQALTLLNDPYLVGLARDFGKRIQRSAASSADRIHFAFLTALSRPPEADECESFLAVVGDDDEEEETWFCIAQVLLNLDEAITKE